MDIIKQLLAIESEAQEAMKTMATEMSRLTQKAGTGLAEKVAQIERDGAEAVRKLERDTAAETTARIAAIQEEYRHKWESFEREFQVGKKNLRSKIVREVLGQNP
ncbi:MAG: hypothetical protein FWB91_01595 [Defluviitaleaceae bacterium]|nr:hypothetical protein [Defluviitaleaceae bacterium]